MIRITQGKLRKLLSEAMTQQEGDQSVLINDLHAAEGALRRALAACESNPGLGDIVYGMLSDSHQNISDVLQQLETT
jgi:hypothetical protein